MASFFLIIISAWLIPVAFLQFTPYPTVGEERLGSCTTEDLSFLGSFAPAPHSTSGKIAELLLHEAMSLYVPGDSIYTTVRPLVQILKIAISCRSISASKNGYSSMTVVVSYSCGGRACVRSYQRADNVKRVYNHHFSFFCSMEDNSWSLQHIEFGFIGHHFRLYRNPFPDPGTMVTEDGKCSLCTSESTDAARVRHSYDQDTGCVSCPSSCRTGSQLCVTSLRVVYDYLACCLYVDPNGGQCLRSCPLPYFFVIPLSNECLQKAILKLEGNSIPDVLCDGDIITYNCSTAFVGDTGSLVWGVTFPGQQTQRLVLSEDTQIGVTTEIMNFQATLLQLQQGGHIISTLSVIVNADNNVYGTEVSCTINSLTPVVETIRYVSLQFPPLEPTGFRSTRQYQISLDSTIVMFEWDTFSLSSGAENNRPQYYELIVSPDPVIQHSNIILASPFNVTLRPFTTHTANLFAINCFGRSVSATIQLDVVSPDAFVTNEDTGDISTTYLILRRVNGDVAPSIVCVSSSTLTTTVTWVKGETDDHLPMGIKETNLLPQSGQAVKLDWRRKIHFSDSGTYMCRVVNRDGSSVVGIELFVQYPPTITSVFPHFPVVKTIRNKVYRVPEGYSGVVLTCTAVGWPPPILSWLSNFNNQDLGLLQTKLSHDTDSDVSGYPSQSLQFIGGVARVHAGDYICYVTGHDSNTTESVLITLEVSRKGIPKERQAPCPVKLVTVYFQLQVLDTECLSWQQNRTEKTAEIAKEALIGGIISLCDGCETFIGDSIVISHGPLCSKALTGATVFRGEITTTDAIITSKALCALTVWYQSSPLIRINDEFKFLDLGCSLVVKSLLSSSSCTGQINFTQIIIYSSSSGVVFIFIIMFTVIVSVLAKIRRKRVSALNTKIRGIKKHIVMYQEEDYPDDFNPYTRNIRRSMYEDDITVINEFNVRYQRGEYDEDVKYKTIPLEEIECGSALDYTTVRDDVSTQKGSRRSSKKRRRKKSNKSRLSNDDHTTQQDDYTTQQDDHTTQHSDYFTLKIDDYSTQHDNATSRGSRRSSKRRKKSSNTLQVDDTTHRSHRRKRRKKSQQGDDYTSDYDDSTTLSGSDRSSKIGSDRSSQYGSDRSSQRGSDRSSRKRRRNKDSTSLQDENTTQQDSDHSSHYGSDRPSQHGRDRSQRGSDRSSRRRQGNEDDNARAKSHQSDYTTQQSDHTTQQGDYTTQQGDYTTQQGDYTTQQSDYTTQQGDYTTQQSDYTTQQGDYTTQQSDYTTQQGDYTTQQSDYTTQQGDYTTQQDNTTQQDHTTQNDDYTTQQDDYTTQQDGSATGI